MSMKTMVRKIIIENGRATGVEVEIDGTLTELKARKEVIGKAPSHGASEREHDLRGDARNVQQ